MMAGRDDGDDKCWKVACESGGGETRDAAVAHMKTSMMYLSQFCDDHHDLCDVFSYKQRGSGRVPIDGELCMRKELPGSRRGEGIGARQGG